MRIALGQFDAVIGNLEANSRSIEALAQEAAREGADLLVLPELSLLGYPPRDLLLREELVPACEAAAERLAARLTIPTLVGLPRQVTGGSRPISNSIALCRDGRITDWHDKILLPTYDVFDENRWFKSGDSPLIFELAGQRVGVLVCEDLWQAEDVGVDRPYGRDPLSMVCDAGCDVIVSPSASPFIVGKYARHIELLKTTARDRGVVVAMANQFGANDDLVFDGGSVAFAPDGTCLAQLSRFKEGCGTFEISSKIEHAQVTEFDPCEERFNAIVTAIRSYCTKTGQAGVLLGLSGGIDSALTVALAVAALGPDAVQGVLMPSRFSSEGSLTDARESASLLGMKNVAEISIEELHCAAEKMLTPILKEGELVGLADENIQARLRGLLLMGISNSEGRMLLATSNKSELAVGYSTLYGDMCGGMMPIGDVYKTEVYELSRWMNEHYLHLGFQNPPIPVSSIEKPPSAELRPDQCDQDSLPEYEILDAVLRMRIDEERSPEEICSALNLERSLVDRIEGLHVRTEFKRYQATIVPKLSPRAFGRGRRLPLAFRWNSGN